MITPGNEDSFYVTLASNGSTSLFKNNEPAHFTNKLQHELYLDSKQWSVALVELHYPTSCYNVMEGENVIFIKHISGEREKYAIKPRYYTSVKELVDAINQAQPYFRLIYDETLPSILYSCDHATVIDVEFAPILCLQLGFDPQIRIPLQIFTTKHPHLELGLPQQIFVYTDIIEHQMIGDTKAPLLRITTMNRGPYARSHSVLFNPPHYLPLAKFNFSTIELLLKDQSGRTLPFAFGTVIAKLHFQRLRNHGSA